jgi:hypothetical protein
MNTERFYFDKLNNYFKKEVLPSGRHLNFNEFIIEGDLVLAPDSSSQEASEKYLGCLASQFLDLNYLFYRPQNSNFSEAFNTLLKAYKPLDKSKRHRLVDELEAFVNDWRGDMKDDELNQKYGLY